MSSNLAKRISLNLKSGITVSLISIPLSVSLAVASQSSPVVGVITAIWAGLVASIIGGSNYNIVGPTGALSGILASYAILHGAGSLPTLAILSGVMIFVSYLLKLERFLIFIPKSAIQGFTLGVAIIIAMSQLNYALGLKVMVVHESFIENLMESFVHISSTSAVAVVIFVTFLVALFVLSKKLVQVPGAVILAPIGILIGFLSVNKYIPLSLMTLGEKFPQMSPQIFTSWKLELHTGLFGAAAAVTVVAVIETLLSAKIADGMTKTKHDSRKEVFALGIANMVSGLFGGIPATAALARTSLNIKSGATDKISGTISSLSIIVISLVFLSGFKYLPLAVIASILVFVAIRMVEVGHFGHMFRHDKVSFGLSIMVAFVTFYKDPIIGIIVGAGVSLVLFMHRISEGHFEVHVNGGSLPQKYTREDEVKLDPKDHTLIYTIKGSLAYINSQSHIARFERPMLDCDNIVLRLRELYFIDSDGVDAIDEIIELCKSKKKKLFVTGVNTFIAHMLRQSDDFRELESTGKVLDKSTDVLKLLGVQLA